MTTVVPSIVKTVVVPLAPDRAFALFTDRIGDWWPLATHSVGGTSARGVTLDERAVVETLGDGTTATWGEVLEWSPPHRVVMTWHPGTPAGPDATQLEVTFEASDDGTLVRLEHSGWERTAAERHANYSSGWDIVLGAYVAAA